MGLLLAEHGAEQHDRLDVAAEPADVRHRDHLDAGNRVGIVHQRAILGEGNEGGGNTLGKLEVTISRTARHLHVDPAFLEAVFPDEFKMHGAELRIRSRALDPHLSERPVKALHVAVKVHELALDHGSHFVNPVPEDEAAIENRYFRF